MTMTEGTAPKSPSAFPADQNPFSSLYGFQIDTWVDQPVPATGPDWFPFDERFRRNANENAYQQHGTQLNWNRYIALGFFVFEDCVSSDKVWALMEKHPLLVHRSIWYNLMYHVDRDLQVPDKLHARE
jgi:hypothetical protein